MPTRLCLADRCPRPAVRIGRCAIHARERDAATHRNKHLYNSAKWRNTRRLQLHLHPMCAHCDSEGRDTLATEVDHIIPVEQGGPMWDRHNHQSLCKSHHSMKTRREQAIR